LKAETSLRTPKFWQSTWKVPSRPAIYYSKF
jgi:hypothetical protein